MSNDQSFEGTWGRLSQVTVKGAQYDSRERQPHLKCLEGTRVDLLKYIHGFLNDTENNRIIWLHGTAGVGKSAVAFTVAERMRSLKVTDETNVEKRLAGTSFFSRKHTKRCTTGYFFATLVYQLATNFPSIQQDVDRTIRNHPALLDPDTSLRDQMEALFLQPLRKLQFRLCGCLPLTFVVDALDECTPKELTDLVLSLAWALHEPGLPVTHILLTSCSESTEEGQTWLQIQRGQGKDWLLTEGGENWLQTEGGEDWLQTQGGQDWLQTEGGRDWLQTEGGEDWLQTRAGQNWLQTRAGQNWLQTKGGQKWLQTRAGQNWLRTKGGQKWLQTRAGQNWLQIKGGRNWLQTKGGKDWVLGTEGGRDWLLQTGGDWLQTWLRENLSLLTQELGTEG